jgi:hypothetical protein
MTKEAVVVNLWYYLGIFLVGVTKVMKIFTIVDIPAQFGTRYLSNTNDSFPLGRNVQFKISRM